MSVAVIPHPQADKLTIENEATGETLAMPWGELDNLVGALVEVQRLRDEADPELLKPRTAR